jgi:hypothetical protein
MLESVFEQRQAIKHAINKQDVQALKDLLDSGVSPDIELPGMFRFYPLGYAIIHGGPKEFEMIKVLVAAGADLSLRDEYGHTPLENAIQRRKPETMKLLLDAGASAKQTAGQIDPIPLVLATKNKGFVEETAVLLNYGADPYDAFDTYSEFLQFFSDRKDILPKSASDTMKFTSRFGRFY